MGDAYVSPDVDPPTEPGFYRYDGGHQNMIFLLRGDQWYVIFDNATMDRCHWGYIEQALSVWNLVRIESEVSPIFNPADEGTIWELFRENGYLPDDIPRVLAAFDAAGIAFAKKEHTNA